MTKKDFFRLIIKLFGLYAFITVIFSGPFRWAFLFYGADWSSLISVAVIILLLFLLLLFLIFLPDKVIGWFKLDRGFDNDQIQFQNFNVENIIMLAVIVMGGIIIIKNIPSFLTHSFYWFKSSVQSEAHNFTGRTWGTTDNYIAWASSLINLIIGYLLLTNYPYISKILRVKSNNPAED